MAYKEVSRMEISEVIRRWRAGQPATHRLRDGAVERNISEQEIREAGSQAITIEEYPDDKYGPTRLLLGFTGVGRPLHIQVADSPSPTVRIITLYYPDPAEWEDYERRR